MMLLILCGTRNNQSHPHGTDYGHSQQCCRAPSGSGVLIWVLAHANHEKLMLSELVVLVVYYYREVGTTSNSTYCSGAIFSAKN